MAGGGKKTVNIFTAVSNAARHAWGVLKGFYNTFRGVWDSFKKVYDTVKATYDKVVGWAKDTFGPLIDAYNKLKDLYEKHVKPVLDWTEKTLKTLEASYLAFKGEIIEALYPVSYTHLTLPTN